MINNIVHISSANTENRSFGTGFVIENNEHGVYILTCEHVLRAVQSPMVESHELEIIAQNDFLDMAIVFIPSLDYEKMTLQLSSCPSLEVKSVAFSSFKEGLVQKSTIRATLFKDFIELHSTKDDSFYLIKKIKADEDYIFSKGNSGAPIICTKTGDAIAMLSNKEGHNIAYAIGVSCIKNLLEQLHENQELREKHQDFYVKMSAFKKEAKPSIEAKKSTKNRAIFHMNELKKEKTDILKKIKEKVSKLKYFLLGILTILAFYGVYSFVKQEKTQIVEYYNVTKIPSNDTLNVREGEGRGHKVIYELPYNAHHLTVLKCTYNDEGKKWCKIKYKGITGWVYSYYIEKE